MAVALHLDLVARYSPSNQAALDWLRSMLDIQTGEISGDGSVWLNPILVGSGLKTSDGPRPTMFFFGQDLIDDPVFMVLETWRIEKRKPFLVYDSGLYYSGVCVTQD